MRAWCGGRAQSQYGLGCAYSAGAHLAGVDVHDELLKVGVCEARSIVYAVEELEEILLGVS